MDNNPTTLVDYKAMPGLLPLAEMMYTYNLDTVAVTALLDIMKRTDERDVMAVVGATPSAMEEDSDSDGENNDGGKNEGDGDNKNGNNNNGDNNNGDSNNDDDAILVPDGGKNEGDGDNKNGNNNNGDNNGDSNNDDVNCYNDAYAKMRMAILVPETPPCSPVLPETPPDSDDDMVINETPPASPVGNKNI